MIENSIICITIIGFLLHIILITTGKLIILTFSILHAISISILILNRIHKKIANKYFYLNFRIITTIIGLYFSYDKLFILHENIPLY